MKNNIILFQSENPPKEYPINRPNHITDPKDVVSYLRKGSLFESELPNEKYMENVAKRCVKYNSGVISIDDPKSFLNDLIDEDIMDGPYF